MLTARYIPKGSTEIQHPDGLGVVYLYDKPSARTEGKRIVCAIGYRGKANRSAFHYNYVNEQARIDAVFNFFESLSDHKEHRAKQRADRKKDFGKLDKDYFSAAETAVFVRKALAAVFPSVKFSVRSSEYSMGASVDVGWTDGPLWEDVNAICDLFEGAGFDGMIDMKYHNTHWLLPDGTIYFASTTGTQGSMGSVPAQSEGKPHPEARRVRLGADYVQAQRRESRELMQLASRYVAEKCQLPELEIDEHGCFTGPDVNIRVPYRLHKGSTMQDRELCHCEEGEWFSNLIGQVARTIPVEVLAGKPMAA